MRLELHEVKQKFSQAIKAVRQGEEVILTERGEPFAVIQPLRHTKDEQAIIRRLEAEGVLRAGLKSDKPMPTRKWKPIRVKGKPMSETISEEREDRF